MERSHLFLNQVLGWKPGSLKILLCGHMYVYVYVCKAYDFVPRVALWCALQKYGVPDVTIDLIRSLHYGMSATVTVGRERSEPFMVQNGLHQGCTIAPTLYIMYSELVIAHGLSWCNIAGVDTLTT